LFSDVKLPRVTVAGLVRLRQLGLELDEIEPP
jgi:hypothetical protein